MRQEDLRRYKRLLEQKQLELFTKTDSETLVPAAREWQGDLADDANADAEAELQIHLHESDGRLARAIESALARMRRGTYGVCTICTQPISKPRLEAVPWTHLCRDCKERKTACRKESADTEEKTKPERGKNWAGRVCANAILQLSPRSSP